MLYLFVNNYLLIKVIHYWCEDKIIVKMIKLFIIMSL
jgi:hypothetical protein